MYKRLPTETQDFFEQVDACHLEILSTLWLEAINHEWRFQSDFDGTPSSTIASVCFPFTILFICLERLVFYILGLV